MVKSKKKPETVLSVFGLEDKGFHQGNVDFFNANLEKDNIAFVDYNRLLSQSDKLSRKMTGKLKIFLSRLFSTAAKNKEANGLKLLEGVKECNHTFLGYSAGRPGGNSIGKKMKPIFLNALAFLKEVYHQDQLSFNAMRYGIRDISYDRVSDITVSIIKEHLIEYTQQQCDLYQIECKTKVTQYNFDSSSATWKQSVYLLPNHNGKPIILIPKKLISSKGKAQCSISQFVSYGFKNYIQNSDKVRHLRTNGNVTYKAYREHLKKTNQSLKDIARELLSEEKDILSRFEGDRIPKIQELSTDDLQKITIEAKY